MIDNKKQSAVEQAKSEIAALGQREVELLRERQAKADQLKQAETEAGDRYLDGQTDGAVDGVVKLQAEVTTIGRAVDAARARRLAGIKRKWAAEAAELRGEGERKKRELEDLEAKTAPHLAALSKIEGIPLTGGILSCQSNDLGGLHIPASARLRRDLVDLAARIVAAERREFSTLRLVEAEGNTIDCLLSALTEYEGETPTMDAVLEWEAACQAHAAGPFGERFRRYRLSWDPSGKIKRDSHVEVPELAYRTRVDEHTMQSYTDSTSGIFKAFDETRY